MAVNKVVYNTENGERVLVDLTNDTVTPETLTEGYIAHDASGEVIVGKAMSVNTHNTDATAHADIRAAIPTVPTKVSAFANDAGYLTQHQSLAGLATTEEVEQLSTEVAYIDPTDNENIETEIESAKEELKEYIDTELQVAKESGETFIVTELAKRGQLKPEFANSIAECTDTSKLYVLPDGYIYAYTIAEKVVGGYTNKAEPLPDNTTDTSKWVNGYRFSSSAISAQAGTTLSNIVSCKPYDVIYIKAVTLRENADRVAVYENDLPVDVQYWNAGSNMWTCEKIDDIYKITITNYNSRVNGFRFAMPTPEDASQVIVTVNEEIVEGTVVKEYAWTNTYHAFIPNEYDEEFVALDKEINQLKINASNLSDKDKKIEESISELESKVEKIGTTQIPDYWQDHISDKIATVKALQDTGGKDCFSFIVMTDMHYPSNLGKMSPLLAKRIMDDCDIKFALCLGDTQTRGCHASKSALLSENELITEMFAPIKDRLLRTQGNHDGNYGTLNGKNYAYRITPQELHSHIYRKVGLVGDTHFDESGSGYWIDDTANKVRFIILNTHNSHYELNADGTPKYDNMHKFRFGQSQYDLVVEALKTVPTDSWSVVMAGHVALGTNGGYSAWGDGTQQGADCYLMENLLTAYKNKTSFNGSFLGTWGNDAVSVDCDFTTSKGNIVGFFGGHTHTDSVTVQGINRITTRCDAKEENTTDLKSERVAGTITEQSFDVFTVNRATRKIYATKIGAGSDREISY